jgi:hypothetical protein
MDHQNALEQHRAIFQATIEYLLDNSTGRVIADNDDIVRKHYENLQSKGEKHYHNGELKKLQRLIQELDALSLLKHDNYVTFIKERTGYDAEMLQQTLPASLPNRNKSVIINSRDVTHKKLAEIFSPDNKRTITIHETCRPPHPVMTNVDIHFGRSGASVYMVEGANLDINVYWKNNNTLIIETSKEYVAKSKHANQYQCLGDVVKVEYVVR